MVHSRSTARILLRVVTLLAAFGVVTGYSGMAQSGRGNLVGSVKDSTGAIIPAATLELKETNTGSSYNGQSSADGLFSFPELLPGHYTLTVSHAGFQTYTQKDFTVEVGSSTTLNVVLNVGSTSATVSVNGDASHLRDGVIGC